jgi:hypothetical protein
MMTVFVVLLMALAQARHGAGVGVLLGASLGWASHNANAIDHENRRYLFLPFCLCKRDPYAEDLISPSIVQSSRINDHAADPDSSELRGMQCET